MKPGYGLRLWLALHATVPLALLTTTVLQHWAPAAWAPLHSRPTWPTWACLVVWSVGALLLACFARSVALWRTALGATALLLAVAAVAGSSAVSAGWLGFAVALLALGVACLWGSLRLADAPPPAAARRVAAPRGPKSGHAPQRWAATLHFLLATGCLLYAFWVARSAAPPLQRAGGMAGMLVAFCLLLPAAAVRTWSARSATVLLLLATLALGGLAWRTGVGVWVCWALGASGLAGWAGWQAMRRSPGTGAPWQR